MDEVAISRAITQTFLKEFMETMEVDVAIAGAGPAGLTANAVFGSPRMGLFSEVCSSQEKGEQS